MICMLHETWLAFFFCEFILVIALNSRERVRFLWFDLQIPYIYRQFTLANLKGHAYWVGGQWVYATTSSPWITVCCSLVGPHGSGISRFRHRIDVD
jgi:hypothetical protein